MSDGKAPVSENLDLSQQIMKFFWTMIPSFPSGSEPRLQKQALIPTAAFITSIKRQVRSWNLAACFEKNWCPGGRIQKNFCLTEFLPDVIRRSGDRIWQIWGCSGIYGCPWIYNFKEAAFFHLTINNKKPDTVLSGFFYYNRNIRKEVLLWMN